MHKGVTYLFLACEEDKKRLERKAAKQKAQEGEGKKKEKAQKDVESAHETQAERGINE